jgi:hypothetical protein
MWTAGDYMHEISFGHLKITDHTATPFTIRIKICPCAYRACTQMGDVYIFGTTVTSCVSISQVKSIYFATHNVNTKNINKIVI